MQQSVASVARKLAGFHCRLVQCDRVEFELTLAYPDRGGVVMGVQPPIESSKKILLCVCKIYSPSPALVFIKSKIL